MSSGKNILLVDDDAIILLALSETLIQEGYNVTTSNNPLKALELLKAKKFGLIISDQRMTELQGSEFLARAKLIQPSSMRILVTGVLNLHTIIDAVNKAEIFRFVPKPWVRQDLLRHVRDALNIYKAKELPVQLCF